MDDEDLRQLRELEESLWRESTRFDRAHVERVYHPDFLEFGQSGRIWQRQASIDAEPSGIDAELPLPDWRAELLTSDVALVHYVSRTGFGVHNRTSVWLRTDDGWRLRFHQGTPRPS
jgi:hypothetical protein